MSGKKLFREKKDCGGPMRFVTCITYISLYDWLYLVYIIVSLFL